MSLIANYKAHTEERAALGVPPLALTAEQVAQLVELLKASPIADQDDGSCMYCSEESVNTENPCTADLDNDGVRGTPDLLILLSFYGLECE